MVILLVLQTVYTLLCIYLLLRKVKEDISITRKILYSIYSFIVLMGAFGLPLLVNNYDPLTRGFILYLGLYFVTMALLFPDEFIKDKMRPTTIRLSNYILYYYLAVYAPIIALNISNTLSGIAVIGKTLLIVVLVLAVVVGIRYLERKFKDRHNEKSISIGILVVVMGLFVLTHNFIGQVNVKAYDERTTNTVFFDDDSYIAEDFSFTIENLGSELFDFAIDEDYLYLLSGNQLVDTLYVSILDKETQEVQKTYEFYPKNDKYTWFIHLEQDFVFNQEGIIYFTFIDGVYTIDVNGTTKISELGDQDSYKFLCDDEFHIATKEDTNINVYKLTSTGLVLVDTIDNTGDTKELSSINNYLMIKDTANNTITSYKGTTYTIPGEMMVYPVLSANDEGIILSDDLNALVLEFGGEKAMFNYYFVDQSSNVELVQVDDYMYELQQFNFEDSTVLYEVFPTPTLYDTEFKDVKIPDLFIHDVFGKDGYSLKSVLVQKDDSLYGIYYKIQSFKTNKIYVEIDEVKKLTKTYDLGFFTDFSKEAYMATMLLTILYACNNILRKKGDWIPKHR